ncbi:aldolase/citrate lyase family protein [Litoreibacter sp.]|nr:aldolase/citrate lyase family protein [Litoreibacter sp.]
MPTLKTRLHQTKDRMTMHMCTIASAAIPQAMAAAGADVIFIDLEHGGIDYAMAHAMIAATAGTGCAPLVRIAETNTILAKRALDMGAEGLVFPMIRTAEDAQDAVECLRYPPNGTRGFGPFLAHSRWQTDLLGYRDAIEPHLVCSLLIETRDAVENIDAICAVEGIDMIIPALFDLSTDLGIQGQFDHPDLIAALTKIETAAKAANLPLGGIALAEQQAKILLNRGYRLIAGVDILWLKQITAQAQSWLDAP